MDREKILNTNKYFKEMAEDGDVYSSFEEECKKEQKLIIDEKGLSGYDSQEYKAWADKLKEKKQALDKKYPEGSWKAYRAWFWSNADDKEDVIFEDFCWDREVPGFVETLIKAGIRSFIYTNHSTAVMDNIHGFIEAGCYIDSFPVIEKDNNLLTRKEVEYIKGIKFIVPEMKVTL